MAGGSIETTTSTGGKKSVDFQLNLVPFIDLLSVLISFLLMTAVWTQVGKIDVQSSPHGSSSPLDAAPEERTILRVVIKRTGYSVATNGGTTETIDMVDADYDAVALAKSMASFKARHPAASEVALVAEDAVPYREVIRVMDLCLQHELPDIKVGGVDV